MAKSPTALPILLTKIVELSPSQLRQLQAFVNDRVKKSKFILSEDEALFYSEIVSCLRSNHISNIPLSELKVRKPTLRGFDPNKFLLAYENVEVLRKKIGATGTIDRVWFYRLCANCVYKYVRDRKSVFISNKMQEVIELLGQMEEELFDDEDALANLIDDASRLLHTVKRALPAKIKYSLGITGILAAFEDLEEAIDDAFPGYIKSGVLPILLKSFQNKKAISYV